MNKPDEPKLEDCNKSLFDWCKEGNLKEIENSYKNQLEDEEVQLFFTLFNVDFYFIV